MSIHMEEKIDRIVDLAKAGNNNAMKTLYNMNREKIMNLAIGYTRNREDAEEILHDTFITAFSALKKGQLKKSGSFHSWIYRIGINTSINFLRKEKKYKYSEIDEQKISDSTKTENNPENETIKNEKDKKILKAISMLAPKQRMIFTLKHQKQMKIREISNLLGCSEGNVKTQLFRAIRVLRRELIPEIEEGTK